MTIALKIFSGVYGALLALLGGRWWFSFEPIAAEWLVEPLGPQGVNNLVADMGALFFSGAIMIALGLRSGHSVWLLAVALMMAVAAAGRLFAYATIGYVPETLVPLIFEIARCAFLLVTHQRMTSDANALD